MPTDTHALQRQTLLALLESYGHRYPEETGTVTDVHAFITREDDCFERSLADGHLTGSAWVVSPDGRDVLLTHHAKLDRWLQLGGHADGDPNLLAVALREAREESGIQRINPVSAQIFDLDVHEIPARGEEAAHLHYDVRFAFRAKSRDYRVTDESHDLAWVPVRDLAQRSTEPSMLRMGEKWIAQS